MKTTQYFVFIGEQDSIRCCYNHIRFVRSYRHVFYILSLNSTLFPVLVFQHYPVPADHGFSKVNPGLPFAVTSQFGAYKRIITSAASKINNSIALFYPGKTQSESATKNLNRHPVITLQPGVVVSHNIIDLISRRSNLWPRKQSWGFVLFGWLAISVYFSRTSCLTSVFCSYHYFLSISNRFFRFDLPGCWKESWIHYWVFKRLPLIQ